MNQQHIDRTHTSAAVRGPGRAGRLRAGAALAIAAMSFGMTATQPAGAEVDTTAPVVGTAGKATVNVDWRTGPWVKFSGTVHDTAADGQCITAMYAMKWSNGGQSTFKPIPGATACGRGSSKSFGWLYDYTWQVLHIKANGAYTQVCQTNSSGRVTGPCGPPRYAANNGS